MKHLKAFEKFNNYDGEEPISLELGKYIRLESLKSNKAGFSAYGHPEEYNYMTKAKNIEIYINYELTCALMIDERHFNTIMLDNNFNFPNMIKIKDKFIKFFNGLVVDYLFDCHHRMKASNPKYGGRGRYNIDGEYPLLTHHYFEFVKNDFETSNSDIVLKIKEIQKDFPMHSDANKYNL